MVEPRAASTLEAIAEVAKVGREARKINFAAAKLTDKLLALEEPLVVIQDNVELFPDEILRSVRDLLIESGAFLTEYIKGPRGSRGSLRRNQEKKFAELLARAEDAVKAVKSARRSAESQLEATDRASLMVLFENTSGWADGSRWGTKTRLKDWHGVEMEGGRVTSLNLENHRSGTKLQGIIPQELGDMAALTKLTLSYNSFTGSIPPGLGRLIVLKELRLNNCRLTGSVPTELGMLQSIVKLDFSFNGLEGRIPNELCELTTLETLNLSNNKLSGSIPPEVSGLTSLKSINLSFNKLSVAPPIMLGGSERILKRRLPKDCRICIYPQGMMARV